MAVSSSVLCSDSSQAPTSAGTPEMLWGLSLAERPGSKSRFAVGLKDLKMPSLVCSESKLLGEFEVPPHVPQTIQ